MPFQSPSAESAEASVERVRNPLAQPSVHEARTARDVCLELDLEEAIERVGYGPFQWVLLFITANTQLADAMELMVISFLSMHSVWCHTSWAKEETSAISSVVFGGMLAGALITGRTSDVPA